LQRSGHYGRCAGRWLNGAGLRGPGRDGDALRDNEHFLAPQLIDDAPLVHGEFADILIVELRHAPADVRCGGKLWGALVNLPRHGFGVEG
jgi:hypothetical protein